MYVSMIHCVTYICYVMYLRYAPMFLYERNVWYVVLCMYVMCVFAFCVCMLMYVMY